MISVRLIDEEIKVEENCSLAALLAAKGYADKGYAVVVNRQFVPMAHYVTTQLQENDCIEIIVPMQGG